MARTRRTPETTDTETEVTEPTMTAVPDLPADGEFSFETVEITPAPDGALPKAVHAPKHNPLLDKVRDAADDVPQQIPVPNGAMAQAAERLLRRAAIQLGMAVKVRFLQGGKPLPSKLVPDSTESLIVIFQVQSTKAERTYAPRQYTNADIREHLGLDSDVKITPDHRRQYRQDKGLPVRAG
jgi:hypothetical protein